MKSRQCGPEERRGRMRKAREFFDAAAAIASGEEGGDQSNDALVTLYVHAGIAASDAICCARLGVHASGENHAEAVELLRSAVGPTARHLQALLSLKSKAGYSHVRVTGTDVKRAQRAAEHLLDAAGVAGS